MKYLQAIGMMSFFVVAHAHAMLMDCASSPDLNLTPSSDCITGETMAPSPVSAPVTEAVADTIPASLGFQINAASSTVPLAESAPLIVFFAILIAFLLVRAKSLNNK